MSQIFRERVLRLVQRIPQGKVVSYREVARRAGNPKAARAVGSIMRANRDPKVPCHRVIRSDGYLGGYNAGGPKEKLRRLRHEDAVR